MSILRQKEMMVEVHARNQERARLVYLRNASLNITVEFASSVRPINMDTGEVKRAAKAFHNNAASLCLLPHNAELARMAAKWALDESNINDVKASLVR